MRQLALTELAPHIHSKTLFYQEIMPASYDTSKANRYYDSFQQSMRANDPITGRVPAAIHAHGGHCYSAEHISLFCWSSMRCCL
jgi:hypothetical protein